MKCHGCGHEFPNTSARCPRCHRSTSRRGRTSTDSRLLEFPRRTRFAQPAEASAPPLPAWRVELNEKVRAIRANRVASTTASEQPGEAIPKSPDLEAQYHTAGTSPDEGRAPYDRVPGARSTVPGTEPSQQAVSGRRSSNNIVEAALTRVKRATENASRASLPKIEPARSIQTSTQGSLAVDRQATARALDPAPDIELRIEFTPTPKPEIVQPPVMIQPPAVVQSSAISQSSAIAQASVNAQSAVIARSPVISKSPVITQSAVRTSEPIEAVVDEPSVLETSYAAESEESAPLIILEEIEPLDYLEAEVRKVDKALGAEFLRNESPSIVIHAVIGLVDLIAIAVSCSPFLAIVMIADGAFSINQTRLATGGILALIAFFYLILTQGLCGRTFGMMLTNTRIVDSQTFELPSPSQALLRTIGCFIAAAPALIGIIWAAFNYKHRGWQDFLSRTVVVRDF